MKQNLKFSIPVFLKVITVNSLMCSLKIIQREKRASSYEKN